MQDEKEIISLIQLLDDPDDDVFEAVRIKLNNLGSYVIPYLEEAWEKSFDNFGNLLQSRIELITQNIQFNELKDKLKKWKDSESQDLFEGALLIASYQYPEIKLEDIEKEFLNIKKQIWLELNSQFTALEKVRIINHILYNINSFERSNSFYRSAQSHFVNNLITSKKGSPISMAILYVALGQKLGLPVYGVPLPQNFIVGYKTDLGNVFENEFEHDVLFYINPFNKGVAFGKKEVYEFIKQQKIEFKTEYIKPCSNKETIAELIKVLIAFYTKNENKIKIDNYNELLKILYF